MERIPLWTSIGTALTTLCKIPPSPYLTHQVSKSLFRKQEKRSTMVWIKQWASFRLWYQRADSILFPLSSRFLDDLLGTIGTVGSSDTHYFSHFYIGVGAHMCVRVPTKVRAEHETPWSWSHGLLWDTCCVCWVLNSGPLDRAACALTQWAVSPVSDCICHVWCEQLQKKLFIKPWGLQWVESCFWNSFWVKEKKQKKLVY